MGIESPLEDSESELSDSEIVSTDNSVSSVLYSEQTIGSSQESFVMNESTTLPPSETETSDDYIIYLFTIGIGVLIILEIIRILKPSISSNRSDDSPF